LDWTRKNDIPLSNSILNNQIIPPSHLYSSQYLTKLEKIASKIYPHTTNHARNLHLTQPQPQNEQSYETYYQKNRNGQNRLDSINRSCPSKVHLFLSLCVVHMRHNGTTFQTLFMYELGSLHQHLTKANTWA